MRNHLVAVLSVLLMAQSLPAQGADTWSSCNTGLVDTSASVVTVDSSVSGMCIITFKSGQTFTIPAGVASIQEALVVGGGGGGGFNNNGGGGGGGEVKYRKTALSLSGITQLKITIGDGGLDGWISATSSSWTYGENGSPSSINDQNDNLIVRAGGGGGGCGSSNYRDKSTFSGSAGGACSGGGSQPAGNALVDPTSGWERFAKAGGPGGAGGGGGAGVAATGVNGGAGIALTGGTFSGTYGGGGGGWTGGATGGAGGGGTPITGSYTTANADRASGTDGTANTGGGGGAAKWGGSGVIKLMYSIPLAGLVPTFGTPIATADGFRVQITNYSASYSWAGSVTSSGVVSISDTGTVTVTSVATATSSTLTITTTRSGYSAASASVAQTSSKAAQAPITITSTSVTYGNNLTLTSTGGSTGGAFTYTKVSGDCSISGSILTPTASGSCIIQSSLAETSFYLAETSTATTITISRASLFASISLDAGTLVFRQFKTITATATVAGKVTFRANGKKVAGCIKKRVSAANSYIATCAYRPSTRGYITITTSLNPSDSSYIGLTNSTERLFVFNRSGTRYST